MDDVDSLGNILLDDLCERGKSKDTFSKDEQFVLRYVTWPMS